MMKTFFITMALVALAIAAGYEIIPLSELAEATFDPDSFNISNFDSTLYNVTRLPDNPNEATMSFVDPPDEPNRPAHLSVNQTNIDLASETFKECNSTGSTLLHPEWCVPSWEHDKSQCNVAYLVPHTPRPSGKVTIDAWVYDYNCERVRGCKLNQHKERHWWSIYGDLKYTVESLDRVNGAPDFKYSSYTCKWPFCTRWTYVYYDSDPSIYIWRHGFTCNQG